MEDDKTVGEGESEKSAPHKDLSVRIKDETRDELLKDYAESTMNELLGLYGYDKVINSSDTENLNLDRYTSSTPLEGSRYPVTDDDTHDDVSLDSCDSSSGKSDFSKFGRSRSNSESNLAAQHRNLVTALTKKHGLTGAPEGTIPSGHVVCAWCQKPGGKNFTLKTEEKKTKAFCSEVCFTQCRRASFKKNKICDWCKHVRHTVNYVDFQDGETQLQFCSSKCLNQYKMNIFCKETQEHLQQIQSPSEGPRDEASPNKILITPELWLKGGRPEKREIEDDDDDRASIKSIKREVDVDSVNNQSAKLDSPSLSDVRDAMINKRNLAHHHRERSRRPTRKESPPRSASLSSDPRGMSSPSPSNFPSLNPWMSPHMWGAFGMAPMGAMPPWFFPGMVPPGLPGGFSHIPEHFSTPPDHRANVSPSNRPNSSMEYDSDSSSGNTSASRRGSRNLGTPNQKRTTRTTDTPSHVPVNPFPPRLPPVPIAHQNGAARSFSSPMAPPAAGLPPMTMVMPVPVPVPLPVPIPLPLPITMEKIMEVFGKKEDKRPKPGVNCSYEMNTECNGLDRGHSDLDDKNRNDINENEMLTRERLSCVSCSSDRSGSVASCSELPLTLSEAVSRDKRGRKGEGRSMAEEYTDFKRISKFDEASNSCDEAIDLSRSTMNKKTLNKNEGRTNHPEKADDNLSSASDEGGMKVPKIHIISPRVDPPLSQQLPLPPVDPKYSSRRGLILDAPRVPKRQRSPSPERRSYARTVPRDVMEAARRRCLRARIRTK